MAEKIKIVALFAIVVFIFVGEGICQQKPEVHYSLSQFYGDSSHTLIELYYGVMSSELVYSPSQGGNGEESASVEFTMTGEQTGGKSFKELWRFNTKRVKQDTSKNILVGTHSFMAQAGMYSVRIVAVDTNARSHADTLVIPNMRITDEYAKPGLHLSSIELGNSMRYATSGETSVFIKNGVEIIPNVIKRYEDKNLNLTYYAELYNIQRSVPGDSLRIQTVIYDADKNIFYDNTAYMHKNANSIVLANTLPIESLVSGKYYLRIGAFPSVNKYDTSGVVIQVMAFYVDNSQLPPIIDPLNAPDEGSSDFASKSEANLDTFFFQCSGLATQSEKNVYKQLSGAEPKAKFLYNFWKARNDDPNGGMTLKDFYVALDYVNTQFKTNFKAGWRTDRGKTYLKYGAPSRIDNTGQFNVDTKPYVIWYYDGIEGGVEFDFVDENGYNDFKLENSTARNELHDTNWQTHYNNVVPGQ